MQVTEKLREFWAKYNERTDGNALAKLTGKDASMISKILTGAYPRTSTEVVKKINAFYRKRAKEVELLNSMPIETVKTD